jgi:rSAM/selenodomain-associated transferase 1
VKRSLIVFVKWPQAGRVKTRLAADIGPALAAAVYRGLAEAEIAATRPRGSEYERLFFFAPVEARAAIAAWLPGETLLEQEGADLGARMSAAFDRAFARGAEQVAIVGTDVPWVGRDTVLRAFDRLGSADVVVGPCHDGGYYLLALSQPRPEVLAGIAWGTPAVLPTTLERAGSLGLRAALLEPLADVDTLADVRRAWGELRPLLPADLVASLEARLSERRPRQETGH